jgi:imipenem/basic amino acid-specific outer membrane pore
MKKTTSIALSLISASSLMAADSITNALKESSVSGQVRSFYINRDIANSTSSRDSLAIGGKLKVETGSVNGLSAGVAFYTTNGEDSLLQDNVDKTLFGEDGKSYTILGEAYLKYVRNNFDITTGKMKLNTPLAGSDDARMIPNLFNATVANYKGIKNTTLVAAHVTEIADGSFSNAYAGGNLAITSGYGLDSSSTGEFVNMGSHALGMGNDTDGVSAVAVIYTGIANTKVQVWDYQAHDILNALYAQVDTKVGNISLSAQYLSESDIGSKLAGTVDANYYGVKAGTSFGNTKIYAAYSTTGDDANGKVITTWGGIPAFTQGMVTRHMFQSDVDAIKVAAVHNLKNQGMPATLAIYYANFDMGANNEYSKNNTAKETGFDFKYNVEKNFQLRLRANYARDFKANLDWDEYRVIANYSF